MARGSGGFVAGVVAGSVLVGLALIALQFLPEAKRPVSAVRDQLMAELGAAGAGVERALPKELRREDCDIATRLEHALDGTVRPPIEQGEPQGPYDYETHELRIDAALGATACKRLGRLGQIDVAKVRSLNVVRRVVKRALADGQIDAARGWSGRLLALGLDLEGAAPATHGTVGAQLASTAALAFTDVILHPGLDAKDAAESLVLIGTLDSGAPTGAWVIDKLATDRMRRGVGAPEVMKLSADQLDRVATAAAEWWSQISSAVGEAGAELPPRPSSSDAQEQVVLDLLTDGDVSELVAAHREARAYRMVAMALTAARVRAAEDALCGEPWTKGAPPDPRTGVPMSWDAASCTLTAGDASWTITERLAATER